MMMKSLQIILLVSLLNSISYGQNHNYSATERNAPNFKLENLDRELLELNDLIGSGPILLCFWSSCCKSAVAQVETFSTLFEKYKDDGFIMLAIATDDEKTVSKLKPVAKIKKFNFPVLYDSDGSTARIYYAYDMPFYVLIDTRGKIVYSHLGYMKGDEIELENRIIELLQAKK